MDLIIKKLSPALTEDFLGFFDCTPHNTGKDVDRCYCVGWAAASFEGRDFSDAQKRRSAAVEYINGGALKGYLAYSGERVVGWCSANTKNECLDCQYGRMYLGCTRREKDFPDEKVKSVFCFAVAPDMREKGVAGMLLERVCTDAALEGFDYVEAYPNKEFCSVLYDCMGPRALYERAGFALCYEIDPKLVMRKKLR